DLAPAELVLQCRLQDADDLAVDVVDCGCEEQQRADDPAVIPHTRHGTSHQPSFAPRGSRAARLIGNAATGYARGAERTSAKTTGRVDVVHPAREKRVLACVTARSSECRSSSCRGPGSAGRWQSPASAP